MNFRGPRPPRPPAETVPRRDQPFEIERRRLDRILRDRDRLRRTGRDRMVPSDWDRIFRPSIPLPTPDERAPYPVRTPPRPPIELPPMAEPGVPVENVPERITAPRTIEIPPPEIEIEQLPLPGRTPPERRMAPPRPAPVPRRRPAPITKKQIFGQLSGPLASILRPILRRDRRQSLPISQPFSSPLELQPELALPTVPPPTDRFGDPVGLDKFGDVIPDLDLTRDNATQLGFAQLTQAQPKEDECVCEETPEEKEANRRPSNKVAAVKPFQRRMSQNSLDNLRKG